MALAQPMAGRGTRKRARVGRNLSTHGGETVFDIEGFYHNLKYPNHWWMGLRGYEICIEGIKEPYQIESIEFVEG